MEIETITAKELYDKKLRPVSFVVRDLLPQGVHIFAGPPKIGKSWLLLQLALTVASGKPLWDLETEQGTVLSLCLEDTESRLQQRLYELTDEPPDNLFLATFSQSIAGGLCDQLTEFLDANPDTNLVIIDTLQKVRGSGGDGNLYASDYQDVGRLKQIADQYDLAMILVHHLRKREASDPHSMISGTTGLLGAADGSYVFRRERPEDKAVQLHVRGRDLEERMLTLVRDDTLGEWSLVKMDVQRADPFRGEPVMLRLMEMVKADLSFDGTATELAERLQTNLQPNILSRRISHYRQALSHLGITFFQSRSGKQRTLSLRYYDGMTMNLRGEKVSSQNPETVENTGEIE